MHLKSHQVSDDTQNYEGPSLGQVFGICLLGRRPTHGCLDTEFIMLSDFFCCSGALCMAAVKYLKARGINSSLWEFLKQYLVIKNDREHLDWLKNIKGFSTMWTSLDAFNLVSWISILPRKSHLNFCDENSMGKF